MASAKLRPTRRRRLTILEAEVFDATGKAKAVWFNRAWLADRLLPGARLLLRGKLEKRGFNVAEHEFLGGESTRAPAGLHTTGVVPVHPASERLRPQRIREWVWQTIPMARHAVEPIPGRLRRELRMAGAADCTDGLALPGGRARRRGRPRAPRLRGALPLPGGPGLAPRPAGLRSKGHRAARARRARSAAWLGLAPFELTGDQRRAIERDRRRPRPGPADAAAADGRGGLRQDGRRPLRDAARDRGRPPGRADGARPRPSPSSTSAPWRRCSPGSPPRPRCSPRPRRRPAAASCSTRWPPASLSWWSARMP